VQLFLYHWGSARQLFCKVGSVLISVFSVQSQVPLCSKFVTSCFSDKVFANQLVPEELFNNDLEWTVVNEPAQDNAEPLAPWLLARWLGQPSQLREPFQRFRVAGPEKTAETIQGSISRPWITGLKRLCENAFAALPPDVRKGCALPQSPNAVWGYAPNLRGGAPEMTWGAASGGAEPGVAGATAHRAA